jgi:hypothetical protein
MINLSRSLIPNRQSARPALLTRYAAIRVPTSGLPTPITEPGLFDTEAQARQRVREIEGPQLKPHRTFLDIVAANRPAFAALRDKGIIF